MPSKFLGELPSNLLSIIDARKYDRECDERLKLSFSEVRWHPGKELKDFIKKIIEDFSLSATSFNSYINCPKQFFYDHIIRVPKAKDFNQSYGTAVHKALENLFLIQIREGKLPTKHQFVNFYIKALDDEILTPSEILRAKEDGTETLEKYYDYYFEDNNKKIPVACEYKFDSHNVHYEGVPISGRIDKIEMIDSIGNIVRIIDYKTSSPKSLNELLGKTKSADRQYLYQAFFYKLLAECDPLLQLKKLQLKKLRPKR